METRTVKFNIKAFVEEYIFLYEGKDKEGVDRLLERFNARFYDSEPKIQDGMQMYLFNSPIAREYEVLYGLATRRTVHF